MSKYTFIKENDGGITGGETRLEMTLTEEYLPLILDDFEAFLRGAGFVFDGHLTITEEDK